MSAKHVNPTRMELTRQKRKLVTAMRGHKLLKDKRDELMRQFLYLVRENKALRERVEAGIHRAHQGFLLARAGMSDEEIRLALLAPKQEIFLQAETKNFMNVAVPSFHMTTRTSDPNDIYAYGLAFTSADLDQAVGALAEILPDLLRLAEIEKACQQMAAEIEKTRRRVNALEHVVIPETQQNIRFIKMKLDENERSAQTRLMKVKDQMLENAHHYQQRSEEKTALAMQEE